MIQICKYNPLSDVAEVIPELDVDIAKIMEDHTVVSTGDTSNYSKETDINTVGHYLRDDIDIMAAALAVNKSMADVSHSTSETNAISSASSSVE